MSKLRTAVFMHSLESGAGGTKHRWLEASLSGGTGSGTTDGGHVVDCPDTNVSHAVRSTQIILTWLCPRHHLTASVTPKAEYELCVIEDVV